MLEKIRQWSYQQQFLGKRGVDAYEVLKAISGVYSAHPSGPLSLNARLKEFTPKIFFDLDLKQQAFRMPAMRTSVYMLPKANAAKLFAATIFPASSGIWEKRYSEDGRKIPIESYDEWKNDILNLTKTPLSLKELKPITKVPSEKLKFVLNRMAFEGFILRIGAQKVRSNIISYVSTEAWAGKLETMPMPEAQAWLAGAYLKAFGPARIKDFQWWAGIKAGEAKLAMATQNTVDIGDGLLILESDSTAFEQFEHANLAEIDILPQWDAYTMGYAPDGRKRFIEDAYLTRLYGKLGATGGNALGAVMKEGQVIAAWTSRFKGTKMEVSLDYFEKPSTTLKKKVEKAFEPIGELMLAKNLIFTDK